MNDLILCLESGSDLLTVLTTFVKLVLAGRSPAETAILFFCNIFGRCHITLNKKSEGSVLP